VIVVVKYHRCCSRGQIRGYAVHEGVGRNESYTVIKSKFHECNVISAWENLRFFFSFLGVGWDQVHSVRRPLTGLLYQPRMIDDECGAVGGMRICRWNRSPRRKPVPVPLCPPQIPLDLTLAWTLVAAVGSRRLTAWAMARPNIWIYFQFPWKSYFNCI
jgi:hypothetical protein